MQKSKQGALDLVRYLGEQTNSSQHISLIQEPYCYENRVCFLRKTNMDLLYFDTKDKHQPPRTAIYASKRANLMMLPQLTSRDCVAALWMQANGHSVVVCSLYLDIKKDVISQDLQAVQNYCERRRLGLLIGVDSNAHSSLWGNDEDNARGEALETFLMNSQMDCHNRGQIPTFHGRGQTIIDLTLSNSYLELEVNNWGVVPGEIHSDHSLITFTCGLAEKSARKWQFNYPKADWEKFTKLLTQTFDDRPIYHKWNDTLIESEYDWFMNAIHQALTASVPLAKPSSKIQMPSFWTDELTAMRRQSLKLKKKSELKPDDSDLKKRFVDKRKEYKKLVRRSKREYDRKLLEEIKDPKSMAKLVRMVQGRENQSLGMLKRADGSMTETTAETLELLFQVHFPGSEAADENWKKGIHPAVKSHHDRRNRHRGRLIEIPNDIHHVVNHQLVKKALTQFGNFKAAGTDRIKPIVFRHLPERGFEFLTHLYRASLATGYMPKAWLENEVIFIPKPGKKSYDSPKSFRPISLASFFLKGLERISLWFIEEEYISKKPISRMQHGFRADKSTNTAIITTADKIEKAILRDEFAVCVFLDIAGAFDNLRPNKVIAAMKAKGLPDWYIRWYGRYLQKRYAQCSYKSCTVYRLLKIGAPQGGVTSPFAWDLTYDPLLIILERISKEIGLGFADDGRLLVIGKDLAMIYQELQKALDAASKWGDDNGLDFNPLKTEVVLFTRKYKYTLPPQPLKMKGVQLEVVKSARYLGVQMDRRLNWHEHVTEKIKQAKRKTHLVSQIIGKSQGPRSQLKAWAFKQIIIPGLSYGVQAWAGRLELETVIKNLRKLNRLGMNLICPKAYRSTPTRSMEIILDFPPLHLELMRLACNSALRTKTETTWDGLGSRKGVISTQLQLQRRCGHAWQLKPLADDVPRKTHMYHDIEWINDKKTWIPDDIYWCQMFLARGKSWGYSWQITRNRIVLKSHSGSIPIMETKYNAYLLIMVELSAFLRDHYWDADIAIFTGLPSTGFGLTGFSKSKMEQQIYANLKKRGSKVYICGSQLHFDKHRTTVKCKAFNQARLQTRSCDPRVLLKMKEIQKITLADMLRSWNQEWLDYSWAAQTKQWFTKFIPTKRLWQYNTDTMAKIVQFITGHGPFLYHWVKSHPEVDDTSCRLCLEEEETPNHLAFYCPAVPIETSTELKSELEMINNALISIPDRVSSSLLGQRKDGKDESHHDLEPLIEAIGLFLVNPTFMVVFERLDEVVE